MKHINSLFAAVLAITFLLGTWTVPVTAQENTENQNQENQPVNPDINRIVMYKNGLAYFERAASVSGDKRIQLQFKEDQMKDILASFYAVDLGGGSVTNITFDSKAPISRQMKDLLIDIPETDTTAALLKQLQGAPITFVLSGSEVTGKLMGLQTKEEQTKEGSTIQYKTVTLLTGDGKISRVDLRDVRRFEIQDANLRKEVNEYLKLRLQGKHRKKKALTVHTQGGEDRGVLIGYQIEAPVWKSSYRLLFRENQKPMLLGWASVENQTTEDWNDVQVQLVAGNPVSFKMDLYTPFYPERPEVPISILFPETNFKSLAGTPGEEEVKKRALSDRRGKKARQGAQTEGAKENDSIGLGGGAGGSFGAGINKALQTVETGASGEALGEMFSYTIDKKVSIERGKSAMVPILKSPVEGDRVVYFNKNVSAHPMNAFHLENTTNLTLDAGPVTVFQEGASLGEALISEVMKPEMKTMLPYAVESGVQIRKTVKRERERIHRIEIKNGVLTGYRAHLRKTEYEIRNRVGKEKPVVIDHPEKEKYELKSPKKASGKMDNFYRFEKKVGRQSTETLTVVEKRVVSRTQSLSGMNLQKIGFWLNQRELSESQKDLLNKMKNKMAKIQDLEQQKANARTKIQELTSDQKRYRQNMRSLTDSREERELRSKYVQKLKKAEQNIEKERERMDTLQKKIDTNHQKLKDLIESYGEE